jgi:hypothetical protein
MARPKPVDQQLLDDAYAAWPGTVDDKTTLQALLLRIRIERVARGLPRPSSLPVFSKLHVARRLLLSVGEPGLNGDQRINRLRVARAAVAAYRDICDILHGRNPDLRPPLADTTAWNGAVAELEAHLRPTSHTCLSAGRQGLRFGPHARSII